jgi:MFS family permease
MVAYVRRAGTFGRDIRLFFLFNLLIYVGFGVFGLVYNLYLYELDLREDFIGAFTAVQTLTMAAAALTMSWPINRFGVWRCITVAALTYPVLALCLAFVEAPAILLIFSCLLGISLAYMFTTTMPFIIEFGRRDHRTDIAALVFSLISLASTLGSLVGGFAPELAAGFVPGVASESVAAYRWTLVIGTVIASFSVIPLLIMGEARRRPQAVDHAAAKAEELPHVRRQVRRDMAVFVAVGGIMSIGAGMVFPFYNVYLTTLGASPGEIGIVFAISGLFAAVIGLGAPALGRRVGSLWAVFLVRNAIAPFYLLLIFAPSSILFGLAVVTHLVRQTTISMAWPLDSTFISEVLPARARSSVFGLRSGVWNLGWSAASLFGGWVIVRAGYGWPFASLVAFTFLSSVLYVSYYSRHPEIKAGRIPSAVSPARRRAAAAAANEAEPAPTTAPAPTHLPAESERVGTVANGLAEGERTRHPA